MKTVEQNIFTIGHSGHTIQRFVELLRAHDISAIADVRSMPYSQYTPQFNKDTLKTALKAAGIHYVFLGEEFGARRSEKECYVAGKARYELIARTPAFSQGLKRLQEGMQRFRVALLCAEKDPLTCHRTILVCRHLRPLGLTIAHILDDGRLESHAALEERLLKETGVEGEDLFTPREQAIERAYDIQSERIAYTSNSPNPANEDAQVEHQPLHHRVH